MSENHDDKQPFFGKFSATLVASLSGGVLLLLISSAYNAPKEADATIQRDLAAYRSEVIQLRSAFDRHQSVSDAAIAELKLAVKEGTRDRYTSTQAEDRQRLEDERWERTKSDIENINRSLEMIRTYLIEEERIERSNGYAK